MEPIRSHEPKSPEPYASRPSTDAAAPGLHPVDEAFGRDLVRLDRLLAFESWLLAHDRA
jgi:hypothetical protein